MMQARTSRHVRLGGRVIRGHVAGWARGQDDPDPHPVPRFASPPIGGGRGSRRACSFSLTTAFAALVAAFALAGCATHSESLTKVRESLLSGQPDAAWQEFSRKKEKPDDLLYLLERGYLAHEAGEYDSSNAAFDAAELRYEELYTKSVSNELAALVTSDNTLPYRGYPHELVLIHYYRAFNYLKFGRLESALVEARKANQRLTELQDAKEGKSTYKNDAFMQYFTAMLYASAGEHNDATVAYRDAYRGYDEYARLYGVKSPPGLASELHSSLMRIGAADEAGTLLERYPELEKQLDLRLRANAVVFVETGFTPYLEAVNITLPIFEEKDSKYRNCKGCEAEYATVIVDRYGNDIYAWQGSNLTLDHVLHFSFPRMVDFPSEAKSVGVRCSVGNALPPVLAEPINAIAKKSFNERIPKILLKTVARALVKELARTQAKKEDKALGALVNIFNVVTERADTRSCLFLPNGIWMVQMELPPGDHQFEVLVRGENGAEVDRLPVSITVPKRGIAFERVRSFR